MDKSNLSNVRQRFGGVVYNWKIHEVAAEEADFYVGNLRLVNIVLTTLTIIILVLPQIVIWKYATAFGLGIAVSQIIFLIVQLYFTFEDRKINHKKSALEFQNLRNAYIALMSDIINNIDNDEIIRKRNELSERYRLICFFAPQTTRVQYEKTRKRLSIISVKDGEDFTLSEDEIDHFLTGNLKQRENPS